MKSAAVLSWHREGFKTMWRRKSRSGRTRRPRIPREHIGFIKRISGDHPEWGEDKIAEELAAKFGIQHSPSTIRRYMAPRTGRRSFSGPAYSPNLGIAEIGMGSCTAPVFNSTSSTRMSGVMIAAQ